MQLAVASPDSPARSSDRIKVYNEMEKYNEWEFLYDPTKDTSSGLIGPSAAETRTADAQQPGNSSNHFGQQQQPSETAATIRATAATFGQQHTAVRATAADSNHDDSA
jgi:hypothetical protein